MAETFLKAKCKRTGKLFGLTVDNKNGKPYIRDFVPLEQEAYDALSPQYSVDPHIEVASTLLPCKYCGTRKFAACSCSRSKKVCNKNDKYDYQCIFCDQMEFDYSGSKGSSTNYSKWVGVTNIPAKAFDKYGNPQGDEFDLAKDGSMHGFKVYIICSVSIDSMSYTVNALRRKGFEVEIVSLYSLPSLDQFKAIINAPKTQVWVMNGTNPVLRSEYRAALIESYKKGNGLYLWCDNDPLFKDTNEILYTLYGEKDIVSGDYQGYQVISIRKDNKGPGIIPTHPIAVGIQNFFEGVTISNVRMIQSLKPLVYSSDGKIVTAYDDSNSNKLMIDGGFTRLYHNTDTAGTDRFIVNCAVWLANIEKWGVRKLPEFK